jgi:acetylornithine deacetylase/succinyl-diaminopimelate desuccinylase-like protein
MRHQALAYSQAQRSQTLTELQALLRLPSISTLPDHAPEMARTARWLADKLAKIGLENVNLMPTGGPDVVYGDWLQAGPAAPTVLIYGHYDVQPVDPLDEWRTPPFEPTRQDDYIYARGATDDKGQFYTHIAAVEAYLKSSGRLPLNVKFLLEGEEEIGSPHLPAFVEKNQTLLRADATLIADSPMVDPQTPVVVTGVRGLTYMEVTVRGSNHDLHSGQYGGVVENPLNALVKMLAALRAEDGTITIPGFYDRVRTLTPAERAALNENGLGPEQILAETGAPAIWGEAGYSVSERLGVRPTLDIHGIRGGFTGAGQKTIIPAVASAKVSMRLVPDQAAVEIGRLFAAYLRQLCPPTMTLSVDYVSGADPAVVDLTAPALRAAAKAYEQGFGQPPLYKREGGTLPIVGLINQLLKASVVMMGYGLPDDNLHAPNERFYLPNFYRGLETNIHFYDIFGQVTG